VCHSPTQHDLRINNARILNPIRTRHFHWLMDYFDSGSLCSQCILNLAIRTVELSFSTVAIYQRCVDEYIQWTIAVRPNRMPLPVSMNHASLVSCSQIILLWFVDSLPADSLFPCLHVCVCTVGSLLNANGNARHPHPSCLIL
jgi:hypothetical protein